MNLQRINKGEEKTLKSSSNRKILFGILGILIILGTSYALFSEVFVGEKSYTIKSRGLSVYLDETKTANDIVLADSVPVLDERGKQNEKYLFSLVNEDSEPLEYTIYLKEKELVNKTPSSAIRYFYTRDIGNIKVTRNIDEQKEENGRYYLETGIIPSNSTYHYSFVMWIDYNAGNEIMSTEYSLQLEVEATQTTIAYKEEILNGTDPILSNHLVPVVIEDNGTVKRASIYEEWYNYSKQKWANAVVLEDDAIQYEVGDVISEENIESYFVWIPRYKYKLFNMENYSSLTNVDKKEQVIEIEFENKDTPVSIGTKVGAFHSHPAFQAFDSNGFWVGKFESGYKDATSISTAEVNSSDSTKLIIKPNTYSWRSVTVGNAFKVSYDYLRSDESHMIKNTEWGAVAYLQHSAFGSHTSVRINNNNSHLTGYAAIEEPTCGYSGGVSTSCNLIGTDSSVTQPYNTEIGYTASTTGNITGIYDMSGGTSEYVMGYNKSASTVGGSSGITTIYSDFFTNSIWEKYYDEYYNTVDTSFSGKILGDATGEMGPFGKVTDPDKYLRQRGSWHGDYAVFIDTSYPWFDRGVSWTNGVVAGIFSFSHFTGDVSPIISFRVVLTP